MKITFVVTAEVMDEYYETKKVEQKNELKDLSNKFKELKSLIYEYKDKKEKEINELNLKHTDLKNEIVLNQQNYEKLIDEATNEIQALRKASQKIYLSKFVKKSQIEN